MSDSGRHRATVINDSQAFLDLIRDALSDDGWEVAGLAAVEASIAAVAATEPDLLIVDLVLGHRSQETSGWELMLLARSHPELRDVPIILCSADVVELRKRADELSSMADVHVLEKPFELTTLEDLVASVRGPALDPS